MPPNDRVHCHDIYHGDLCAYPIVLGLEVSKIKAQETRIARSQNVPSAAREYCLAGNKVLLSHSMVAMHANEH